MSSGPWLIRRLSISLLCSTRGDTPEALAESAAGLVERYGYTGLKISPQRPGYAQMPENALVREAAARGECLFTKFQFRDLLVRGAADVIQPDVCLAGGLLERRRGSCGDLRLRPDG